MLNSWLKDMPISRKLTLLVQTAVAVALFLSSGILLLKHWHFERANLVHQLTTLSDVLGANTTASLVFDDDASATELLSSLSLLPSIEGACVYDASGAMFACYEYRRSIDLFPKDPKSIANGFTEDGFAIASKPIVSDGEYVGTICIIANMETIHRELVTHASLVAGIILLAFAAAYAITAKLQRQISQPILSLADTAEQITAEENFSIRVQSQSQDEIGVLYEAFNRMLEQVEESKRELQEAHNELELRVERRTRQLSDTNAELSSEVAERKRTEQELERAHRELLEAARSAGMAEVASNVLHNVGNVLNSVNVSASTITNLLQLPKRKQVSRLAELVEEHRSDLGHFVEHDQKGQQLPKFIRLLADGLQEDDAKLAQESASLISNIEHIRAIIGTQQSYAGTGGLVEPIDLEDLLEDAARLNTTSFERHQILLVREYSDLPAVLLDKQRVLQIVINLIKNAKEALMEQREDERTLTIATRAEDEQLLIEVKDTGIGIEPDHLSRIFSHGFSTKPDGHGFGLHSCANAAVEMDGELRVDSPGKLKGATFTLALPYTPVDSKNQGGELSAPITS